MVLEGKRLFIVEDDLRNRMVYKLLLSKFAAHVEFEGWGPDVVKHLQEVAPVDLIVLDLMLQRGSSGYDVFKEIRALPEFAEVPIVAVSAAEPGAAIARTREMGFSGFIAKPIEQALFPEQLDAIVAGRQVWYAGARYEGMKSSG
ncbi:MAG: response regulator [Anaerolineae bacterium]|nr:response regulator [Anaerolineae bacterium]